MWRKNRRDNGDGTFGVDLNRNWGYAWGYDDFGSSPDPSSNTYRGAGPFSEPETQILREFINAHDFAVIANYHSYGNIYLNPWGYRKDVFCPDVVTYAPMLDSLFSFNGYEIWAYLYPGNREVLDWQYGEQFEKRKSICFLPEVGPPEWYFWPPVAAIPILCEENLEANLFFAREAQRLWNRPSFAIATEFTAFDTTVDWCTAEMFSHYAELINLYGEQDLYIIVDTIFSSQYPGWLTIPRTIDTIAPGETLSLDFTMTPQLAPAGDSVLGGNIICEVSYDPNFGDVDTLAFPVMIHWLNADSDGDNIADDCDNCLTVENPGQADPDGDDVGAMCDNCPEMANAEQDDNDGDEIGNACDNCPDIVNTDQSDTDDNGVGDVCDFVCGDANGDDGVNVGDAVYLINYTFKGGPAPESMNAGDPNCDASVDIGDAVYLINFAFKGGPDPCASCP